MPEDFLVYRILACLSKQLAMFHFQRQTPAHLSYIDLVRMPCHERQVLCSMQLAIHCVVLILGHVLLSRMPPPGPIPVYLE